MGVRIELHIQLKMQKKRVDWWLFGRRKGNMEESVVGVG